MVSVLAFVLFLLGFACGYGVREWLSRRRRAVERQRHLERRDSTSEADLKRSVELHSQLQRRPMERREEAEAHPSPGRQQQQ
jgi:hypothetical protein